MDIILDKDKLIDNIKRQILNFSSLKYQRSLLEFKDSEGGFIGDNVFETTFLLRDNKAPLIY
jgi:hypothetical protein